MWLLSTDHAELHYFTRSFEAPGGYAILSHTWDKAEQTLQDVRAIGERCRANGTNPRDDPQLSTKIKECCKLAETHGYHWIWVDFCCIDQTSSSELSEAINSMYNWYKAAEVCFAYLKDVPSDDDVSEDGSAFRKSRWHTRGWTLQELIAPESVIFVSNSWHEIGERAMLAEVLEEITKVPARLLTGDSSPAQFSACARLCWASGRETKRVEDEAYCLMGLFGVSMPTNYGEGRRAFIRLQHEIMQADCDLSLFAFGSYIGPGGLTLGPDQKLDPSHKGGDGGSPWEFLLANSPSEFRYTFTYVPISDSSGAQQYAPTLNSTLDSSFDSVELPTAAMTNYGVECRLPVATLDGVTIAVIQCQMVESKHYFGLFLTDNYGHRRDKKRPRYNTSIPVCYTDGLSPPNLARMCDLGDDLYHLTFNNKLVKASWRTIYIVPYSFQFSSENGLSANLPINCDLSSQFRIPRWLVDRMATLQFEAHYRWIPSNPTSLNPPRRSGTHMIQFIYPFSSSPISIFFGLCTNHSDQSNSLPWARAFLTPISGEGKFTHKCTVDHVLPGSWTTPSSDLRSSGAATYSRNFKHRDGDEIVRLSFVSSMRMSRQILVMHLELFGGTFDELLRKTGVKFPPLTALEQKPLHSTTGTLEYY